MKVIFLDNDGVICLSTEWGGRLKKREEYNSKFNPVPGSILPVDVRFDNFNKKAIKILNSIIEETDAEIVVSSDWKLHASLDELKIYYADQGIIKSPIDTTPNLKDFEPDTAALFSWRSWLERARILEIRRWIDLNNPEKWVSVDDLDMGNECHGEQRLENFVLTPKSSEGIKQTSVKEKIISFLV